MEANQAAQPSIAWPLLAGLLIVLANAFFVTVEFAVVTVRRGQVERLAEEGVRAAESVLSLLQDTDWAIAASQLGITVASILLGVVAEEPLEHLLAPGLARIFGRVPALAGLSTALATLLVLLVLSFFHMVLGEQTPKTIALRYPLRSALVVGRRMAIFHVCGIVTMKDVLPLLADDPGAVDQPLSELGIIKPSLVVPDSRHIGDLFSEMRRDHNHLAIVLDEFGGTAGIVTAEELAEEVVGRLTDEWVTEQPA